MLEPRHQMTPQALEFERLLSRLEAARPFAKGTHLPRILSSGLKLLDSDADVEALYTMAPRFDDTGLFDGGDWISPEHLQPGLVRGALLGGGPNAAVECLSELRILAIALGDAAERPGFERQDARAFLERVLAQNLDLVFPVATEATREYSGPMQERVQRLFGFVLSRLGAGGILDALVREVERVLLQRPIMIQRVERLLHAAERALEQVDIESDAGIVAQRLIKALKGPTDLTDSSEDYTAALTELDMDALAGEARAFGNAMSATGLVSPQHALLLRHLVAVAPALLAEALDLDAVGRVSLDVHAELVAEIINFAILPETTRSIYGLSRILNRGTLFFPPVPPGLRRLMLLPIATHVADELREASEWENPPSANTLLVAGTLSVLGQPRGVDQGHNPTCQAARAISLWAQNDIGYLLDLIARAARDDEIVMHFEGEALLSSELMFGLASTLHTELDPVSLLLTPHLDRVYMEMSRRTIERVGDGHRWVNPEFHGWWVHRSFAELLDPVTGAVGDCDGFIRLFYAAYHPLYNGGRQLVYEQPCGIATTDFSGALVGWHAIAIQRVARDPAGAWRVYFFNPNRDKGQNWGQGVVTSTHDHGEFEGESSLPFEQFASRLYVFHYQEHELGSVDAVPAESVASVRSAIAASWAASLAWLNGD